MNINDPFGRMQSKHQREYESLRDSLNNMGLKTPDDAQALLDKLQRRGIWGLAIIALTTLILSLVLPKMLALILLSGAVAIFWWLKTTSTGKEYVRRYIQEEMTGPDQTGE